MDNPRARCTPRAGQKSYDELIDFALHEIPNLTGAKLFSAGDQRVIHALSLVNGSLVDFGIDRYWDRQRCKRFQGGEWDVEGSGMFHDNCAAPGVMHWSRIVWQGLPDDCLL